MKKFYVVEFLNLYRKLAKTRLILEDNFENIRRNVMAQQDVLDYIRKTPHNSNVNVVKGMLNAESGGGDSWTVLTEESVTTSAQAGVVLGMLTYSQLIDAETIKVTFNGTEYECHRVISDNFNLYGGIGQNGPDFSQYPFAITSKLTNEGYAQGEIYTETAGTYTIKIEAPQSGGSSDFSTAHITVTDNTTQGMNIEVPWVMDVQGMQAAGGVRSTQGSGSVDSYDVILYKGRCLLVLTNTLYAITTNGSVEELGNGSYLVTGDCTITIS